MKMVVDTNVIIFGLLFGGKLGQIVSAIVNSKVKACATTEIIDEYSEIIKRKSHIKISRDPDDDKFIECAKDGKALYIVSRGEYLLEIKEYKNIKIVTVKEFCDKYL